ncbi:MAG: hypothetical protein ACXVHL_13470 [Solirubrobacteraceae bacterium]
MVARGVPARRQDCCREPSGGEKLVRQVRQAARPIGFETRRRAPSVALLCALLAIAVLTGPHTAAAASPDSVFTNMFASLSGSGWVGGDGTNSVALPDGRDCWIFSDTITSSSAVDLRFAHNSIVVTGRGRPQVISNPMPQPSPDEFYWAGAARVHGAQVWEIATRIVRTGPGLWDFHVEADYLAKVNISTWKLASITRLTGTVGKINWGVAMLDRGAYTYIYGSESQGLSSWMHVARVPKGRLDVPWSFYTGSGWAANAGAVSLRLLPGAAPAFSVVDLGAGRGIRVITQEPMMGQEIDSWRAASPVGPFSMKRMIYNTGSSGARTYTYNALAHPEQTADGQMLMSFNVNSFDALSPANATLYHPRFFRIPLSEL